MNIEPVLRDYHYPDVVSWWSLSTTGYVLLGLVVVSVVLLALFCIYWRKSRVKRAALKELSALNGINDVRSKVQAYSAYLRKWAMAFYPNVAVASKQDSYWLQFLDETGKDCSFQADGQCLLAAPYQKEVSSHMADSLENMILKWLKSQ